MSNTGWTWAPLTSEQIKLVTEAEQTLGADYLLVYQAGEQATSRLTLSHAQVAALSESQLECLQGLEMKLQAVVIAYRRSEQAGVS